MLEEEVPISAEKILHKSHFGVCSNVCCKVMVCLDLKLIEKDNMENQATVSTKKLEICHPTCRINQGS